MKRKMTTITPALLSAMAVGNLSNVIAASTPGGIEAQEKAGQIEQSFLETLPKDLRDRESFEKLGFKFIKSADGIFDQWEFPKGWRKKPTDHDMWSDLLDDKGRKRGSIFYKAAFYDRSAFAGLSCRFGYSKYADSGTKGVHAVVITDCGGECHRIGTYKSERGLDGYELGDKLAAQAEQWLDEKYPGWKSPLTHWG